jgi:hypothetical protein
MKTPTRARLRELNDPLLGPLIDAQDETAREAAIAAVITAFVKPLIDSMIARFRRNEPVLRPQDLEELTSIVALRVVLKLRATALFEDHTIASLEDYVATMSYHALHDLRRQRHPERYRLKKNLRYLLTRDHRFAMWETPSAIACGLASWKGRTDAIASTSLTRSSSTAAMQDREHPGDAVAAILKRIGRPVELDLLVDTIAELWQLRDPIMQSADLLSDAKRDQHDDLERRQYLAELWSEIRELPENQRAALLLNLRDADGANAVALFLLLDIAGRDALADAIGIREEELAAIWESLPLDDLTIAARLKIGRQQVINLRSSARSRLARRMARWK